MLFEVFEQLHTMLTSQKTARFNSELSILSDALGMWGWVFGVGVRACGAPYCVTCAFCHRNNPTAPRSVRFVYCLLCSCIQLSPPAPTGRLFVSSCFLSDDGLSKMMQSLAHLALTSLADHASAGMCVRARVCACACVCTC